MRVLHVAQPLHAGVPDVVAGLLADQAGRGWEVHVAHPRAGILTQRSPEAVHHTWEATRFPGPGTIREVRALRRSLTSIAPDLVHLHSAKAGLAGRVLLRGRLPTVFQPHAWSFDALRKPLSSAAVGWERLAARWSDVILCVGRHEKERGVAAGIRAHFEVVPNGVDLRRWEQPTDDRRRAAREHLALLHGAPLVVCVGRLSEQKGQDVLLRAWTDVSSRFPDARLVLVGKGDARERLEASATEDVIFAGEVDDPRDFYLAADLAVIASRWEGMSLAMLEAMATGLPVVSTDVPGAEVIAATRAGAVVPVEDPVALAAAIEERLREPGRMQAEGARGRRAVEVAHDRREVNERIAGIYASVLERRRQ